MFDSIPKEYNRNFIYKSLEYKYKQVFMPIYDKLKYKI